MKVKFVAPPSPPVPFILLLMLHMSLICRLSCLGPQVNTLTLSLDQPDDYRKPIKTTNQIISFNQLTVTLIINWLFLFEWKVTSICWCSLEFTRDKCLAIGETNDSNRVFRYAFDDKWRGMLSVTSPVSKPAPALLWNERIKLTSRNDLDRATSGRVIPATRQSIGDFELRGSSTPICRQYFWTRPVGRDTESLSTFYRLEIQFSTVVVLILEISNEIAATTVNNCCMLC